MAELITKKLVYIVDDDPDLLMYLKKLVGNLGMEVETFATPQLFLARLKINTPDLCFIDLQLGASVDAGYELIKEIHARVHEKIILIVISARDSASDISLALEMGFDDYIVKPIRPKLIETKLQQHLKFFTEQTMPMIPVGDELSPCRISLEYYLYSISELGFIILSPHFIPKQTKLEFDSGTLFEIIEKKFSLWVNQTWLHNETGLYASSLSFPVGDAYFLAAVRKWMLQRIQKETNAEVKEEPNE